MEPLNEPGVDGKGLIVRGRHIVLIDGIDNSTYHHRMLGEMMMMKELPLFVNDPGDPKIYMHNYITNASFYTVDITWYCISSRNLADGTISFSNRKISS